MNILADAGLPALNRAFPSPFHLFTYHDEDELGARLGDADILVCRSTLKITDALIEAAKLKMIATATSGTDHINLTHPRYQPLPIINARGANAGAVADWVLSVFANIEADIASKNIGIIGLGQVGTEVHKRLKILGYKLFCCDPWLEKNQNFKHMPLQQLTTCSALLIHANLHDTAPFPTHQMINKPFLETLNPGCFIINAARGGIVDEQALLETGFIKQYCTDVFADEPDINPAVINQSFICTPHIAGHSQEAKIKSVYQVSQKIHQHLQLRVPDFASLTDYVPCHLGQGDWRSHMLLHYDVMKETRSLKNATDKQSIFNQLRKQHNRHELMLAPFPFSLS